MELVKKFVKENFIYLIILILVILIKIFVFSPIKVNGDSMNSTLFDRDIMILNELSYRSGDVQRFDIVVIKLNDEYIIKRVIGLPGETIEYKDNILYINGKEVVEDFYHKETDDFKAKVPKGEYFVMGDNRINSVDSRKLGSFPKSQILGKTNFVVYPFHRFGKIPK